MCPVSHFAWDSLSFEMVAFIETLSYLKKSQVDSFEFSDFEYLHLLLIEIDEC